MKQVKKVYWILWGIFVLAVFASWLVPTTELIKGIIAFPSVVALLGILFQIFRDESAFEKAKHFELRKRIFDIGATSHMANTAFNKHVDFCEEYMSEVHETVVTLFRKGPSSDALTHANKLHLLRQKYAAWLTDEINKSLEPYEQAVRDIGVWAGFVEDTREDKRDADQRSKTIDDMFKKFREVMSIGEIVEVNDTNAIESVKLCIREILGIEELTKIRKYLVAEAIEVIRKSA